MAKQLTRRPYRGKSRHAISVVREPIRPAPAEPSAPPVKEKRNDSRRAGMIGVGFLLLSGALVAMAPYPAADRSHEAAIAGPSSDSNDLVAGTITLGTADRRCRKTTFDVKTGRVTQVSEIDRPCSSDDHGPTKPTVNSRIDAIGRSFVNR